MRLGYHGSQQSVLHVMPEARRSSLPSHKGLAHRRSAMYGTAVDTSHEQRHTKHPNKIVCALCLRKVSRPNITARAMQRRTCRSGDASINTPRGSHMRRLSPTTEMSNSIAKRRRASQAGKLRPRRSPRRRGVARPSFTLRGEAATGDPAPPGGGRPRFALQAGWPPAAQAGRVRFAGTPV